MRYLCLAADYDGTLAFHGKVEQTVIDALHRLKASTWKLILVILQNPMQNVIVCILAI